MISANLSARLANIRIHPIKSLDPIQVNEVRIGPVNFEGSNPCARCPVPPRSPSTGEIIPGFQKRFSDFRRASLPAWSPESRFDHYYLLATNTRVASTESGKILRVGDPLDI